MEQFKKIVLEAPDGMHYTTIQGENGELIVRLVLNSSGKFEGKATFSQTDMVEESEDKAKFFTQITEEDREKVKNWLSKQKRKTKKENGFLKSVEEALKRVGTDYWIANLEPSVTDGEIYYAEGNAVGVGFSCDQWKRMAKEYAPERLSRLSNEHELYIWYALRIVNGLWSLDYVANDSSSAGNYWDAPGATHSKEKTGARECGGYKDGQGNSCKIVTCEDGYALVGGDYGVDGHCYPVANVHYNNNPFINQNFSSGVLVLTK